MTTIRLTGGVLGNDTMLIRCDLSQASSPVEVSHDNGDTWHSTQYQCADARHRDDELADLGIAVADSVPGVGPADTIYEWEVCGEESDADRTQRLYRDAEARVRGDDRLAPFAETILADYREGDDHWQWVIDADADVILGWAKAATR